MQQIKGMGLGGFVLLGLLGAGLLFVLGYFWHDRERTRAGTVLRHVLWGLASSTTVVSVAYRTAPGLYKSLVDLGSLFAPAAIAVAALVVWLRRGERASKPVLLAPALLYAGVQIVAAGANGEWSMTVFKLAGLLYLPGLAVIACCTAIPTGEMLATVRRICLAVVYGSAVLFLATPSVATLDLPRRAPILGLTDRVAGVTPHPNLLAVVAAILVLLVVAQRARWWWVHALVALACIGLGESRNVAIALAMALVLFWIVAARAPAVRVLVGLPILAGGALLLSTASVDGQSLGADADTFNNRTIIWDIAWRYVPERPLLGWGPFAFDRSDATPFSQSYVPGYYFPHAHNQFVEAAVEGGVLGVAAMAVLVAAILRLALRRPVKPLVVSVAALVLVFMLTEVPLTAHIYGFNFIVAVPALLLVLFAAHDQQELDQAGDRRGADVPARPRLRGVDDRTVRLLRTT